MCCAAEEHVVHCKALCVSVHPMTCTILYLGKKIDIGVKLCGTELNVFWEGDVVGSY